MSDARENRRSFGLKTMIGSVVGMLSGLGVGRHYAEVDHDRANHALRVVLPRWGGMLSCHPLPSPGSPLRWHVMFHNPVNPAMPWVATVPNRDPRWPPEQITWPDPVQAVLESERLMLEEAASKV